MSLKMLMMWNASRMARYNFSTSLRSLEIMSALAHLIAVFVPYAHLKFLTKWTNSFRKIRVFLLEFATTSFFTFSAFFQHGSEYFQFLEMEQVFPDETLDK